MKADPRILKHLLNKTAVYPRDLMGVFPFHYGTIYRFLKRGYTSRESIESHIKTIQDFLTYAVNNSILPIVPNNSPSEKKEFIKEQYSLWNNLHT